MQKTRIDKIISVSPSSLNIHWFFYNVQGFALITATKQYKSQGLVHCRPNLPPAPQHKLLGGGICGGVVMVGVVEVGAL